MLDKHRFFNIFPPTKNVSVKVLSNFGCNATKKLYVSEFIRQIENFGLFSVDRSF